MKELRNIKSFSTLYGISHISSQYFAPVSEGHTTPFYQRVISSGVGAVGAVIVSNPADMIKTLLQAQSYDVRLKEPTSAMKIAVKIYSQEGLYGFWRGVLPRLGSIVPRLTFLKALSEEFTPLINKALNQEVDGYSRK